jgi:hypothetical protein
MDSQNTAAGSSWSGVFQTLATTAQGYLNKRLDIELETKLARLQQPEIKTGQYPVGNWVPTQAGIGGSIAGIPVQTLLGLLAVGAVAVFILKD